MSDLDTSKQPVAGHTSPRSATPMPDLGYDESAMEAIFRRGDWHDWDDCIKWLQKTAGSACNFSATQVNSLVEHFKHLKQLNTPFPQDYREAFNLVREAKLLPVR